MPKVMISGGGTGGHIYPAIAIAHALQRLTGNAEILFVGAKGRMEMEKVPAAGFPIEALWISGLQRKLTFRNLLFPVKVLASLLKAGRLLSAFKPDAVVGVGGYASGPLLYMATRKGIPSLIQEQNSYAGITNKLLGKRVDRICVAYDGMEKYFPAAKILLTGNPVRQDITNLDGKKEKALEHFGLQTGKKTLLVIGGSLGAATINASMLLALPDLVANDIQVLWQTGARQFEEMNEQGSVYAAKGVHVLKFIQEMDLAYAVADLVVSRAGASSISELCLAGKAAILVPSPNVAEDHQNKNAKSLVDKQAAVRIADADAREKLGATVVHLMADDDERKKLETTILTLAQKDAADRIAKEVIKLYENNLKKAS
ncbi:MAG: undecaprenyldiphospho-muramoylpentapeptide beta-N-acetylglucosaminyltransferase [Flavobacteriales bacterium]|nr:undecaprenyldiphospho-muramoylpentapeptide beta-N-acetylglucosaminyltransferase [Flavobacteriales bacterium]